MIAPNSLEILLHCDCSKFVVHCDIVRIAFVHSSLSDYAYVLDILVLFLPLQSFWNQLLSLRCSHLSGGLKIAKEYYAHVK